MRTSPSRTTGATTPWHWHVQGTTTKWCSSWSRRSGVTSEHLMSYVAGGVAATEKPLFRLGVALIFSGFPSQLFSPTQIQNTIRPCRGSEKTETPPCTAAGSQTPSSGVRWEMRDTCEFDTSIPRGSIPFPHILYQQHHGPLRGQHCRSSRVIALAEPGFWRKSQWRRQFWCEV